jgi:hypothetical protein
MNPRTFFLIYITISVHFLIILSNKDFLSNQENFNFRHLEDGLTTTQEKPLAPIDQTIKDMSFLLTAQGETYLKAYLDKEFKLADKDGDGKISDSEIKGRLNEIFAYYQIPTGEFSDSMIKLVLQDAQLDSNSNLSRTEFDKAMTRGVNFIVPHLISLKGTPNEPLVNTGFYLQATKDIQKEDVKANGQIMGSWKTLSQGNSTVSNQAALEFISGVAFTMGLDTSKSADVKKYVDGESTTTLNYDNFYNAFRKTMELTQNYLEKNVLPEKKEAADKYNLANKNNIVSISF